MCLALFAHLVFLQVSTVFDTASSINGVYSVHVGVMFSATAAPGSSFTLDRVELVVYTRPAPVWTKLASNALLGGRFSVHNPMKTLTPYGVTVLKSRATYNSGWIACRYAWPSSQAALDSLSVTPFSGQDCNCEAFGARAY